MGDVDKVVQHKILQVICDPGPRHRNMIAKERGCVTVGLTVGPERELSLCKQVSEMPFRLSNRITGKRVCVRGT